MNSHPIINTTISSNSEPIYCNLIDYGDDFGLDSRLERLRVSALISKNNNEDHVQLQQTLSLPNGQSQQLQQQQIISQCAQPISNQSCPEQQQQLQTQPTLQVHQQSQSQQQQQQQQLPPIQTQPQPPPPSQQLQQPPQSQSQLQHNNSNNSSVIHPYLQYLLSASSTPSHHHQNNHLAHLNHNHPIEDIDCYLNTPAKDFDIGDSSFTSSRQFDSTISSTNQSRFQSYKYLTQVWPEASPSKMLDSPLGRKVYHVAAEQTKTLSPPKEKCVKNYGRVKSWGNSFDNLLNDAIGVKIYSRFLSREFSDENILFWLACEKYKTMIKKTEARKEAKAIYDQFLTINGSHTVNVDADARNSVARNLKKPTKELFDIPQTQVYNLMKNDSYKRFLTSELYEMCLESEKTGKPLPVCSKDDSDKKKVPSSKRRLSIGSWVLKKTFRK